MEVKLPRLGEGADSGSVAAIFVKEGELVKKDQAVLELESEKAVATIPSPVAGQLTKIHVKEGDEIKVGQLIFTVAEGAEADSHPSAPKTEEIAAVQESAFAGETPEEFEEAPTETALAEMETRKPGFAPPASPTIRKLARQLGIDLSRVRGSQRGGRIVLDDLKRYLQRLQQHAAPPQTARQMGTPRPKPAPASIDFTRWGAVDIQKMTTLRKTVSHRMTESWTTIPHVTQFADADVTEVVALQKKYRKAYEKKGAHLTVTPMVLKALVTVLKKHPRFNCSVDEVTEEIVFKKYYNIGVAVDTEQGLLVPVIRDVDKKSLLELSIDLSLIADRARQRKLALDEMQGGTFTISNQGGIGGAHFTPIINKPEVAILGLGRASMKPVYRKNKLQRRTILPLGLSYDHRVIDGADAARFMTEFVQTLEDFKESDVKLRKRVKGTT